MNIHEVLRVLVRGEHGKLRDSAWQDEAVKAIDDHEAAQAPAPAAAPEQAEEGTQ